MGSTDEVCPLKWPWFRAGVANLPANEHQRKLEGSSTARKKEKFQRVIPQERGRRTMNIFAMEEDTLPHYLNIRSWNVI